MLIFGGRIGDMPTLGDCLRRIRAGGSVVVGGAVVLRTGGATMDGGGPCERRRRVLGNVTLIVRAGRVGGERLNGAGPVSS